MPVQLHPHHAAAKAAAPTRFPLNTLTIPLGLAGLAQVWSVSVSALGLPFELGQVFWLIAMIGWIGTLAIHLHRGRRSDQRLSDQLTHLGQGPLAAVLPIAAMLIGAAVHRTFPAAGTAITLVSLGAAAAFAAWILGFWMRAEITLESIHGGYYLPISAAGLVGALAAAETGPEWLAVGSFAIGIFFWLIVSVLFFLRLAFRPTMPRAVVPTLAIMAAPPAVASAAWLAISGGRPSQLFMGLTAMTVLMVMIQLILLPRYRALPFSLGFWAFTFPSTSVAGLAITWLHLLQPLAWRPLTVGLLATATLIVVLIAAKSIIIFGTTWREARRRTPAINR